MDYSPPGFPVLHDLLELAQTHVHRVGDAIQPSHPLSPPSLPALNLSQHQGFSSESADELGRVERGSGGARSLSAWALEADQHPDLLPSWAGGPPGKVGLTASNASP